MNAEPTPEEVALLAQLVEDGWPIAVIAPRHERECTAFQHTALSLLRQGLTRVYGRRDDARGVPLAEAEAILSDRGSWGAWMISATEAGNALLGDAYRSS